MLCPVKCSVKKIHVIFGQGVFVLIQMPPHTIKVLKSGSVDSGSGNLFPGPDWAISGRSPDPESANDGHFPDPELAFPDLVLVGLSRMRHSAHRPSVPFRTKPPTRVESQARGSFRARPPSLTDLGEQLESLYRFFCTKFQNSKSK